MVRDKNRDPHVVTGSVFRDGNTPSVSSPLLCYLCICLYLPPPLLTIPILSRPASSVPHGSMSPPATRPTQSLPKSLFFCRLVSTLFYCLTRYVCQVRLRSPYISGTLPSVDTSKFPGGPPPTRRPLPSLFLPLVLLTSLGISQGSSSLSPE